MTRSLACQALMVLCVLGLGACGTDDKDKAPVKDGGHADVDAHTPAEVPCKGNEECNNQVYCNGDETCVEGLCKAGQPVVCDDSIDCTEDTCVEASRTCRSNPPDKDGDGHYDNHCLDKDAKVIGDDCDDDDTLRYPGNIEVCDPDNHDEDCDPHTFGDKDVDHDDFFDNTCCNFESDAADAKKICGTDCNDNKANVNPKATEACDERDNDCDGKVDEKVRVTVYPDGDHDLHGKKGAKGTLACPGAEGVTNDDDCNDEDPNVYTGLLEFCDDKDNDCDGKVDNNPQMRDWFPDDDDDGFGNPTPEDLKQIVVSCEPVKKHVINNRDCDDTDSDRSPGKKEICNGVDNDCNDNTSYKLGTENFEDDDDDKMADVGCGAGADDCDDKNPYTGMGVEEICDGRDNDCDKSIDEGVIATVWLRDVDKDGYGDPTGSQEAYCGVLPGRTPYGGDCDDQDDTIHPRATEICDGKNQDCDFQVDEGDVAAAYCNAPSEHALKNATAYCFVGSCRIDECLDDAYNCDGKSANGCESNASCGGSGVSGEGGGISGKGGGGASGTTGSTAGTTGSTAGTSGSTAGTSGSTAGTSGSTAGTSGSTAGMSGGTAGTGEPAMPKPCQSATVTAGDFNITSDGGKSVLNGVTCISGNLTFSGTVSSLLGLENLQWIGGTLTINGSAITSTKGLDGLTTVVGTVNIANTGSMTSLDGLQKLSTVGSLFQLANNTELTQLNELDSLESVTGNVNISNNGKLQGLGDPLPLTTIGGSLSISSNGSLLSIEGLSNLYSIGGTFDIVSNAKLENITGVNGLVSVGGAFNINNNNGLKSVSGFGGIDTIFGALTILNNDLLDNVTGFGGLHKFQGGGLVVHDNVKLQTLTGFGALQSMTGALWIYSNPLLGALNGFGSMTKIDGYLSIEKNPVLLQINGFGNLKTIGSYLYIGENNSLVDVAGFGSLSGITGYLQVFNNAKLQNLDGLHALKSIGTQLIISSNLALNSLSGLVTGLTALSGDFTVSANPNLSRCAVDSLRSKLPLNWQGQDKSCCNGGCAACTNQACTTPGAGGQSGNLRANVNITKASELNVLSNVTDITGNLICNASSLVDFSGDISGLGLQKLTSISGDLEITSNSTISTLTGFEALKTIGGHFYLNNNPNLTDVSALGELTTIGNTFLIANNAKLSALDIPKLDEIKGYFQVSGNGNGSTGVGATGIAQVNGLSALTKVQGEINITSNSNLKNLSGLSGLKTIGGRLSITSNTQLSNINTPAFNALTSIGASSTESLTISSNGALTTINGFPALQTLAGNLLISNNTNLSSVAGFPALTNVNQGSFRIYNNDNLLAITGFGMLNRVSGFFEIDSNGNGGSSGLDALGGFPALDHVGGDFIITDNNRLTTISGFGALGGPTTGVNGDFLIDKNLGLLHIGGFATLDNTLGSFTISNNPVLVDVLGFGDLANVGNVFEIRNNDALTTISGIDSLAMVGDALRIKENRVLSSISALQGSLTSIGSFYFIAANPQLSSCQVDALRTKLSVAAVNDRSCCNRGCTTCDIPTKTCSAGDQTLNGQSGVFEGGTAGVVIKDLNDVAIYDYVTKLVGPLDITSTSLSNLTGLDSLAQVTGNVAIGNNSGIGDLNGLTNLTSIGGTCNIYNNSVLTSISGLNKVQSVAGFLSISGHGALANVSMTALTSVGDFFQVVNNTNNSASVLSIANINTPNLHIVGNYLNISNNNNLSSVSALTNAPLTQVGANNKGTITIQTNPKLAQCQALALKASIVNWSGTFNESGNTASCPP